MKLSNETNENLPGFYEVSWGNPEGTEGNAFFSSKKEANAFKRKVKNSPCFMSFMWVKVFAVTLYQGNSEKCPCCRMERSFCQETESLAFPHGG